jgi:hypothetical protein
MSVLTRRLFLRGLVAAPAVIAADRLMPLRGIILPGDDEWSLETVLAKGYERYVWSYVDERLLISMSSDAISIDEILKRREDAAQRLWWSPPCASWLLVDRIQLDELPPGIEIHRGHD